jgi:hypothetical protein
VGLRAGLDDMEKRKYSVPTRIQTPCHPACGTVTLPIMLPSPPKFYSRTGHKSWPWPLYPWKEIPYPLYKRLGWPQVQSGLMQKI